MTVLRWMLVLLLLAGWGSARAEELTAIDEKGRHVPPDVRSVDGYHGNAGFTEADIPRLWLEGLPAKRGTDMDLRHHKLEHSDGNGLTTAFRGLAPYPAMPGHPYLTPVDAADVDGLVFHVRGVPGWDVARHAPRAENLVPGEVEIAILARIEPRHIVRIGVVRENRMGQKFVAKWFPNPALPAAP
jgi:hypothetical protein